jgi:hypothetical protein
MAAANALQAHPTPFENAIFVDRFFGIFTAAGGEAARHGEEGGDEVFVKAWKV